MYYNPNQAPPQQQMGGIAAGYYIPQQQQYQQQQPQYQQQQPQYQQQQPQYQQQQLPAPQQISNTIKDEGIGISFSYLKSEDSSQIPIPGGAIVTDVSKKKKKPSTAKKMDVLMEDGTVIDGDGNAINTVIYADTYQETNELLKNAISQFDIIANDVKEDLDYVRASKTMKGKYTYIPNMINAINSALANKVNAIKEINNSIKAINDAEYRRFKDNRAADQSNDDKYIMDMYNAFISTKPTTASNYIQPPTNMDMTLGLQMVPAEALNSPLPTDIGYQQYLNNLSPEQNAMIYENNPNVKEYVVYDKANNNKYFQWRNNSTGENLQNLPLTDPMFLMDVKINETTQMATNINLNKSWPVIILNESMFSEY